MNNKYCVYMFEVYVFFFLQFIFKFFFYNVRKRGVLYLDEMKVVFFFVWLYVFKKIEKMNDFSVEMMYNIQKIIILGYFFMYF